MQLADHAHTSSVTPHHRIAVESAEMLLSGGGGLLKTKRVKPRESLLSARNILVLVIALGTIFFALTSLTRRVTDPDSVRLTKDGDASQSSHVGPLRLMLASHGRIMWYYPDTEETKVLHEGQVRHQWPAREPSAWPCVRVLLTHCVDLTISLCRSPVTLASSTLHAHQGVHYGTFPGSVTPTGALASLWVVLRPHNWHPKETEEVLLELDAETGVNRPSLNFRW